MSMLKNTWVRIVLVLVVIGLIRVIFTNDKEVKTTEKQVVNTTTKVSKKDEYKTIQSITDINGTWRYGEDTIYFDSKKMIVQWNRGKGGTEGPEMKMDYIDSTDRPDYPYQEFYVYGTIGTTKIFRTRVLINESRNSIYLDRVDGNTPHYYKKVD